MRIKKYIAEFVILVCFSTTLIVSLPVSASQSYENVEFPSLDGTTELKGFLAYPKNKGPWPAVIMLHGCGGLGYSGSVKSSYSSWARQFTAAGLAVLMVDSATPRGFRHTCTRTENRKIQYRDRPKDAYGALGFLQENPNILADRIALVGWSQGGAITLLTIAKNSIGRPVPAPKYDFRVAAAFYPGACNDKRLSMPYTKTPPNKWSTQIPLLVLHGGADNWTVPGPCKKFIENAKDRGNPVSIVIYPGAYHGFDAPNLPMTDLPKYTTIWGVIPKVGTHEAARSDALTRLPRFLVRHLQVD
ncbi:dienelactone hydrolase family protein [Sneathiella marina]|uniref:Dienelactone hydrolase family protein n=1 Tax=Sneathiella marina TaxID=2950108 RepID=A0ABY4WBU4_9PROT|nr:dienelactone hydrolase family protein [Sneathiella marina]USG62126.1 dienelactone hydrolase family protein [Sneathiella marina]